MCLQSPFFDKPYDSGGLRYKVLGYNCDTKKLYSCVYPVLWRQNEWKNYMDDITFADPSIGIKLPNIGIHVFVGKNDAIVLQKLYKSGWPAYKYKIALMQTQGFIKAGYEYFDEDRLKCCAAKVEMYKAAKIIEIFP